MARTSTDPSSSTNRSSALPASRSSPPRSASPTTPPPSAAARPCAAGLSRQALILVLLIALAFGTAIYMGVRHPYQTPAAEARRAAPDDRHPARPRRARCPAPTDAETLYAHSPAAQFRDRRRGHHAAGLPAHRALLRQPGRHRADHRQGLPRRAPRSTRRCSPAPAVRPVRRAARLRSSSTSSTQSFDHPAADGRHAPTGWLVRFDPSRAELADRKIRVQGTLQAAETDSGTLEVTADHTFVYALRPAGRRRPGRRPRCSPSGASCTSASTGRPAHRTRSELVVSYVQAGPLACAEDATNHLRPLLAGQTAKEGGPRRHRPVRARAAPRPCAAPWRQSAQPKV